MLSSARTHRYKDRQQNEGADECAEIDLEMSATGGRRGERPCVFKRGALRLASSVTPDRCCQHESSESSSWSWRTADLLDIVPEAAAPPREGARSVDRPSYIQSVHDVRHASDVVLTELT